MNRQKLLRNWLVSVGCLLLIVSGFLFLRFRSWLHVPIIPHFETSGPTLRPANQLSKFQKAVLADLDRQIAANITYHDGYYIGGDPPANIGVCSDVVIRSYRAAGVDLRSSVATDILRSRESYHIVKADSNIDHRRCRNLAVFFKRHAISLPISGAKRDWEPADIVIFDCSGNGYPSHIAVISNEIGDSGEPLIVHHWPGNPVRMTDDLSHIPVMYHFRWPTNTHHVAGPSSHRHHIT